MWGSASQTLSPVAKCQCFLVSDHLRIDCDSIVSGAEVYRIVCSPGAGGRRVRGCLDCRAGTNCPTSQQHMTDPGLSYVVEPRLLLAVEATEGQVAAAMMEAEANHGDAPVLGMRASKVVVCNTKTVLG